MTPTFDDLLAANARYAEQSGPFSLAGTAQAGVCVLTCMDCRVDPLRLLGLEIGDAKVLRTPGGQLTPDALNGCVLAATLLACDKIIVARHTKCAMGSGDKGLRAKLADAGIDAGDATFGGIDDPDGRLRADVATLREHPWIAGRAEVRGFVYDVDSGRLDPVDI